MADGERYPSDTTDEQWAVLEPLVPAPLPGGRPAVHSRRRIVDAILYVTRTGCAWRSLPHDFPPWATVFWYFKRWRADGVVDRIHDALRDQVRDAAERDPMASAGSIDSQSIKGADTVGVAVRGFDVGKKTNGRKRHIAVDTMGLLLLVVITSAGVQDRDGARTLLARVKMVMPSLSLVWADGGYAGKLVEWAGQIAHITVEIVRKPLGIKTFQVLPRRWVVERTFAWIVRCRRLDHDYERLPETSEAMIKWAMIGLMVRRLAPPPDRKPWQRTCAAA
jgi:transposase